ncbi:aspartate aminotransferase family protein [Natrarchaeobius chitinivorans]|uniref:Glutamate-1-semialdehyde 2,1-aminomutase n=1 Tax=Natrarchaeobius chitinivorans TaxID=1679083 RepID=A0A3N6PE29_NATCH|nr:aminotransferase class III-fold pyridoxal phosphate-dependent enzyme [Natrarchaeobius chitinivorans]RQG95435.1 aminotransferase class III-fold pyridoxal phosphate-dependent enzyme [Natrarchaeobius chitinivorans]
MTDSRLIDRYRDRTSNSRDLFEEATDVFPGGDTRAATYHRPYPSFIESAEGYTLTTADGEVLLDFLNNYSTAVHGHAPEPIVHAITDQVERGNALGAPTEVATELGQRLVDRVPSVESVRFANSGTEATLTLLEVAKAATGRERVLKVDGGYHGHHPEVDVGLPSADHRGRHPENVGTETVAYNDVDALKDVFAEHGEEFAVFVLEPILGAGGMIPATTEYLETARDLTTDTETLLAFDEIQTLRLAPGGAQQRYGVEPDLTALGKVIGGGLPVGAFGGRREIMDVCHPERRSVVHSGTFTANPATMAGGVAALDMLDEGAISDLNRLGATLRQRVTEIASAVDVPLTVTGDGSFFQVHFADEPIDRWDDVPDDQVAKRILFMAMRTEEVFIAPRGMGNLSTPMAEAQLDTFCDAFETALEAVEAANV